MQIQLEKTGECGAKVIANVPGEEVKEMRDHIVAGYTRGARLPGFRPGKVPTSIVAKHFAKEVQEQLQRDLENKLQEETIGQNTDLRVLRFHAVEYDEQTDGSFKLTTEAVVLPSFELPEYIGIEVTEDDVEVSDKEVEDTMERFAEASATFDPVERAATKEDHVVIDFKTTVEGKPSAEYFGKSIGFMEGREDYRMTLQDRYVPELSEGLIGATPGEQRSIKATLSEQFPISDLRGKEMVFHCTVKQVLEKHVPEISAEVFSSLFPNKNLEEIRNEVRSNLKQSKQQKNESNKADQITNYLASLLTFALPEEVVEKEVSATLQRKILNAIQSGDFDVEQDKEKMRNEAREEAVRAIRVFFALQEIALREKITVSDLELTQELARMAQREREKDLRKYIRKLTKEGSIEAVRLNLISSKVMELLVRKAKAVSKETSPTEG